MAQNHMSHESTESQPYLNLYARLAQHLPDYVFDSSVLPFHSSYDNWHVIGRSKRAHNHGDDKSSSSISLSNRESCFSSSAYSSTNLADHVVARVTQHGLRIEREYKQAQMLYSDDSEYLDHFVRPIRLARMPAQKNGEVPLVASVIQAPSLTYLEEMMNLKVPLQHDASKAKKKLPSLSSFLDLAVGACASLEVLHYRHGLVHGEIRTDAFHFDPNAGAVRLINLGSGTRSFRMSSTGWSSLLSEVGILYKLQFFAPEQTGRLAAEPDMRTDIYALGMSFWAWLTQSIPFESHEPLEIIQSVLSQQLPSVQSLRTDIPASVASVICKMTKKVMTERYNSVSSAKHDLATIRSLLYNGDVQALDSFRVAQDDISASFTLPTKLIGRERETDVMIETIESTSSHITTILDQYTQIRTNSARQSREFSVQSTDTLRNSCYSMPLPGRQPATGRRSAQDGASILRVGTAVDHCRSECATPLAPVEQPAERLTHIISISGDRGIGKTFFLRNMQQVIRHHLLLASTQFERTRSQPLDPILKLTSALFRQLFSESNVNSHSHSIIRQEAGPYWDSICSRLDLPAWLLDTDRSSQDIFRHSQSKQRPKSWLECTGINQTPRFMQILLQVLRVVAYQKPLCLCVDDVDYADQESIDLLQSLADANLPLLLIVIHKPYGRCPQQIAQLSVGAVTVELGPFREDETQQYINETFGSIRQEFTALVAVVHDRTGGNPSYIRDFLDRCHASGIISFSWRYRKWEVQMDRVAQCWPRTDDPQSTVEQMIFQRFQKLPLNTRNLLSWAGIIGSSFAFSTLKAVSQCGWSPASGSVPLPLEDPLDCLQHAVSKYIMRPTEDDDVFEFSDDNAYTACVMLAEQYDQKAMHFVLARAILSLQSPSDAEHMEDQKVFNVAEHIIGCLDMITKGCEVATVFLQALLRAADIACSTGGLRKSASYCDAAIALLPQDLWTQEHTKLYIRAAEVYHLVNRTAESLDLLAIVEENAKIPSDKIPTIIIRSRIVGAGGDGLSAFNNIQQAIKELHDDSIPETLNACDDIILSRIAGGDSPMHDVRDTGTELLLAESIMTSLLMSEVLPYRSAVALVAECGCRDNPATKAIGMLYLSAVALFRLKARTLATDLRNEALDILNKAHASYDIWSRGLVLRTMLLGHLEVENSDQIESLTHALESSNAMSDRGFLLLNIAAIAMLRLTASDNLVALESFLEHSTLDLSGWQQDQQNSLLIICVRQVLRSMRGATQITAAETVLCDSEHNSMAYLQSLREGEHHYCAAIYQGCQVIVMNLFGFYKEAMELGITMMPYIDECRFSPILNAVFYHTALAIAAVLRMEEERPDRQELLDIVAKIRSRIELIARSRTPVCQAWLLVLEAEISDDTSSLRLLNFAVETVQGQHFALDEAYCLELYVNCLTRMGAISAVQQLAQRCANIYEQVGAPAKAAQVIRFVRGLSDDTMTEASLPSTPSDTGMPIKGDANLRIDVPPPGIKEPARNRADSVLLPERLTSLFSGTADETPCTEDTSSWLEDVQDTPISQAGTRNDATSYIRSNDTSTAQVDVGTLDVIDLHSIISSSQAMTSELRIDRLLQTLTKIIADTTTAEVCSIIINDEDDHGWVVAATHTISGIDDDTYHMPLHEIKNMLSKQVNTYVLRFREQVFIHNTMESDSLANTFPNINNAKPEVSIICMPILHSDKLLGSLYCQAHPNTFTDRTMTVIQLLVAQISISLHNAMLFKQLDRASNNNLSMIEVQKDTVKRAQQSERKARHAEVRAVENLKQKEEAMKAKSMFLANVSHELRTPLNGVIGMTTILQDTELTAQQIDCCHNIRVCAETLVQIVNDILDYNKLEAGKMMVSNAPMNPHNTLSEVISALRASHTKEDIQTIADLQLDKDLMIIGDSVRLQQVLMNLMSNAYKFTPSGTITVTAKIEESSHNAVLLQISVADSGIGISSEQQKKLFMPFSQADASTARSYGGTGLGLSICKSIVEGVLKGQIWLRSVPGEGTQVSFRAAFPLADANAKQSTSVHHAATAYAEVNNAAKQRKSLHMQPQQIKICIAEDNAINRKIAMSYVKKLGYKYEAYEDGKQAVDALVDSKDFHMVLMDVQMPVLDGYEATKALRNSPHDQVKNVIIIAMTASTIQGDKERCFEAGMDAYVAKPVRLETLREALRSFIGDEEKDKG